MGIGGDQHLGIDNECGARDVLLAGVGDERLHSIAVVVLEVLSSSGHLLQPHLILLRRRQMAPPPSLPSGLFSCHRPPPADPHKRASRWEVPRTDSLHELRRKPPAGLILIEPCQRRTHRTTHGRRLEAIDDYAIHGSVTGDRRARVVTEFPVAAACASRVGSPDPRILWPGFDYAVSTGVRALDFSGNRICNNEMPTP